MCVAVGSFVESAPLTMYACPTARIVALDPQLHRGLQSGDVLVTLQAGGLAVRVSRRQQWGGLDIVEAVPVGWKDLFAFLDTNTVACYTAVVLVSVM